MSSSTKRDEKEAAKAKAWDFWLDCHSYREIGRRLMVDDKTVEAWCAEKTGQSDNSAPASRQHFDIWQFQKADGESSYFGRMPPQVVENLLWLALALNVSAGTARFRQLSETFRKTNAQLEIYSL